METPRIKRSCVPSHAVRKKLWFGLRSLAIQINTELNILTRSLVICEFTSSQKGQFQISWKYQPHVHIPRTRATEREACGCKNFHGGHVGEAARNCKWWFPVSEFSQVEKLTLFPSKAGWCWPAPIFQSSEKGPTPYLLVGNPGNSLGKHGPGHWNVCCGCAAPALWNESSMSPCAFRLPLSSAGPYLHLNYILRAQPRVWHVLAVSKYCWQSESRLERTTSSTHITELHSRGKDTVDATAEVRRPSLCARR